MSVSLKRYLQGGGELNYIANFALKQRYNQKSCSYPQNHTVSLCKKFHHFYDDVTVLIYKEGSGRSTSGLTLSFIRAF